MSLITCAECGHQVSTLATACPSCGSPPRQARTASKTMVPPPSPAVKQSSIAMLAETPTVSPRPNLTTLPTGDSTTPALDLDFFQQVANYRLVQEQRWTGICSIIFGLIFIYVALRASPATGASELMGMMGIFLVTAGSWLAISPSRAGLVVTGLVLFIVGMLFVACGAAGAWLWAILGVFQVGWACNSFRRFWRCSSISKSAPSPESLKEINQIVGDLAGARMARDANIIEFSVKAFPFEENWKARLHDFYAVWVRGRDVLFARKGDVVFEKGRLSIPQFRFGIVRNDIAAQRIKEWLATTRSSESRGKPHQKDSKDDEAFS